MLRSFRNIIRFSFSELSGNLKPKGLYFDYQATTPVDYRVLDAMLPYMTQNFGNPHSKTHEYGWEAETAIEEARKNIADLIKCDPKQIIFTSGATESNNISIKGLADFHGKTKNHIITTQVEHKCVLDSCRNLEMKGFKVTYLPVQTNGILDLNVLKQVLDQDTSNILMCSIMTVNNEIGVIQDIEAIGKMCRERGIFLHTDAAQAVGKIPMDVDKMNIDLMSISGHKLYGPKGIGALYIRKKPRVRLSALFSGGGQQRGFRSGTLAPHLVVGIGKACQIAQKQMQADRKHVQNLYKRLMDGIGKNITHFQVNGDPIQRYQGNANISLAFVEGQSLIMAIKQCAVSSGSACTSQSLEPSYVLRALGVQQDMAHTSIRIGMGRFTTEAQVDYIVQLLTKSINRLRDLSPLWQMQKEGIDIKSINWDQPH